MTAPNATQCPPESALSAFGLGKLDAASADTISQHIETCSDCRQRVAGLSGDTFVGHLRQAGDAKPGQPRERTFVPGESLAGAANSTDGTSRKESRRAGVPRPSGKAAGSASQDGLGRPPHERDGLGSPSSPISAPPELMNHPDYELIKELGQGGMGTVYLAKNRMMDRPEVLKVISKALLDRPGALERFQQEIRSAAKLNHSNIVAAYSVLRPGDLLVFAMEYVKGQDLSEVVKQRGPLPVTNAAFYIHQVANGLQHAFEKGMVHRDIKPNNLMLAIEGKKHTVKILDFGLAKATSEKTGETGLTKSGQMLGTPDYVAPEQTLDAHKADIRADIYSLGCTLYFLLSGGPPFQEASLFEILQAHHTRDPRPLNLVRPEVPVELAAVVAKMMAKDPARRYQTPIELAKALVPFFKPGQSPVTQPPRDASPPQPSPDTDHALSMATPAPTHATEAIPVAVPLAPMAASVPVAALDTADLLTVSIDTRRPVPKRRADGWRRLPPWQRWAALSAAAAALLLGVVLLVHTPNGTIEITLSDPNAKVEVNVDGNRVDIAGLDEPLSLEVGRHQLKVKGEGYETITKQFKVTRGANAPLEVKLVKAIPKADVSKRFAFEIPDPQRARWSIEGDELVQRACTANINIIFGDPKWDDFDFSVEAKRIDGNHAAGLRCHYRNDSNGVGFWMADRSNTMHTVEVTDNGTMRRAAERPGSINNGEWHRLELHVRGAHGFCFLDGNQIMVFDTESSTRGRLGLATWDSAYRFRNIVVKLPDGKILLEGLPDLENAEHIDARRRFMTGRMGAADVGPGAEASDQRLGHSWPADAPSPAIAPFDAMQARAHQEAWAKHLGVPVEQTNSVGMSLVLIPPGEFTMGSTPDEIAALKKQAEAVAQKNDGWGIGRLQFETPAHRVTISRPCLFGATEVTVGQFRRFVDATRYVTEPEQFGGGNSISKEEADPNKKTITWRAPGWAVAEDSAVGQITWNDAVAFCNWLSEAENLAPAFLRDEISGWRLDASGAGYRLPTEAEWEYACRAGTTSEYSFGDDTSIFARFGWADQGVRVPRPNAVAAKLPNPFGLYDMHGNHHEWCHDWFAPDYYAQSPATDPTGPSSGGDRISRGGPIGSLLLGNRSAFRACYPPIWRFADFGFRVMRVSVKPALRAADGSETNPPASPDGAILSPTALSRVRG